MENFTIESVLLLIGVGAILYKLYVSNNDEKASTLKDKNVTMMASKAAKEAAKEALTEVLATNAVSQDKDWKLYKKDIDTSIQPISKSVKELDDAIKQLQKERQKEVGSLESSIEGLLSAHNDLKDETQILSVALTTSSSVRGKWGETMLRNIVEKSGLVNRVDFAEQEKTETSQDLPDMTINLPGGGIIPVDAKTPMKGFKESLEEKDEDKRIFLQKEFAKNCRGHMQKLSQKKYHEQFDNSINFVIMVIPYEPGYQAALMHDGELFNDGQEKRVYVVSPITLMPILSLIANTWRQMNLSKNAEDVVKQAQELSKRLRKFESLYDVLGTKITKVGKAYDATVSSYQKRLKPSVRNIQKLQGIEIDDKDLAKIELDVKPVIERISIEVDTDIEEE